MDLRRNIWIMKNFPLIQSKFVISNPSESSISLANPFLVCVFVFVIDFLSSCRINFLPLSTSWRKFCTYVLLTTTTDIRIYLKNDTLYRIAHDDYIVIDTYIPRHRCKSTWTLWTRGPYCEDLFGLYPRYLCKQTYTTTLEYEAFSYKSHIFIIALRAIFNWAPKVIRDCFGFALLYYVTGSENSCHIFSQSDALEVVWDLIGP